MTNPRVSEIEARLAKATPGEWDGKFAPKASVVKKNGAFSFGPKAWPICILEKVNGYPEPGNGLVALTGTPDDQDLIAHCKSDLARLTQGG